MQVTYTEIAKLVNEIDGSNIDRRAVKRRMDALCIKAEELDSKTKVKFAVNCCSVTQGAWYVVNGLAKRIVVINGELKVITAELEELKQKCSDLETELAQTKAEFAEYYAASEKKFAKMDAELQELRRKNRQFEGIAEPPETVVVDPSEYGYDEDGELVDKDGNYVNL